MTNIALICSVFILGYLTVNMPAYSTAISPLYVLVSFTTFALIAYKFPGQDNAHTWYVLPSAVLTAFYTVSYIIFSLPVLNHGESGLFWFLLGFPRWLESMSVLIVVYMVMIFIASRFNYQKFLSSIPFIMSGLTFIQFLNMYLTNGLSWAIIIIPWTITFLLVVVVTSLVAKRLNLKAPIFWKQYIMPAIIIINLSAIVWFASLMILGHFLDYIPLLFDNRVLYSK